MNITTAVGDDLQIERNGMTITRVTKNGVVIWPVERHTAGMQDIGQIASKHYSSNAVEQEYLVSRQRANDSMVGGAHYKNPDATGKCPHCRGAIEHWDWAYNLRALEYAATKYLARWRNKGGLESLKKVIHYTQKLIEIHFPETVVTVQYSNKVGESGPKGVQEAHGSSGVVGGQTSHQTAVDQRCPVKLENGQCVRYEGHEGTHLSPGRLD